MIETFAVGDKVRVKDYRAWVSCPEQINLHGVLASQLIATIEGVESSRSDAHYYRVGSFQPPIKGHPRIHMWFAAWEIEEQP